MSNGVVDPGVIQIGPPAPFTTQQMGVLRRLVSRSPYYVDDAAFLRVRVVSGVAVTVSVSLRIGRLDGGIENNQVQVAAGATHVAVQADFPLREGLLFNAVAFAQTGAPLVGQTFVQAFILVGSGTAGVIMAQILGGQVTASQPLAWPGSLITTATQGEPVSRTIIGTNQGIGFAMSEVVPTGVRWRMVTFSTQMRDTVSLSGATFNLKILAPSTDVLASLQVQFTFPAVTALQVSFMAGFAYITTNQITTELPCSWPVDLILVAGTKITSNVRANGSWGNIIYTVKEWQEGN